VMVQEREWEAVSSSGKLYRVQKEAEGSEKKKDA